MCLNKQNNKFSNCLRQNMGLKLQLKQKVKAKFKAEHCSSAPACYQQLSQQQIFLFFFQKEPQVNFGLLQISCYIKISARKTHRWRLFVFSIFFCKGIEIAIHLISNFVFQKCTDAWVVPYYNIINVLFFRNTNYNRRNILRNL